MESFFRVSVNVYMFFFIEIYVLVKKLKKYAEELLFIEWC